MGHGTDSAHGHGSTSHGPASAAGHAHAAGAPEIPPAPAIRHITPAPEDFATSPAPRRLLWPILWAVVVVLAVLAARAHGWHDAGHAAPAPHAR